MRRIAFLLAAAALATAPLAPAAAATSQHQRRAPLQLCYFQSGTSQCDRIENNDQVLNNPIVNGNDINGPAENVTTSLPGGTYDGYTLEEFHLSGGGCIGVSASSENLVYKNCSGPDPGAYGVLWANGPNLINRAASEAIGFELVMTGGSNGSRVQVADTGMIDQTWGLASAGRMVRP
jgi:hypothetical protein